MMKGSPPLWNNMHNLAINYSRELLSEQARSISY